MVHILVPVICAVLLCLPPALATSSCVEDLHFLMHGQQWTWHDMRGVNSSFGPLNETLYPAASDHYITVTTVNTGLGWCGAFPKGVVTFHLRPDSSDMAVWKEIWLWHEFQILDEAVLPGGPVKRVVDLGGNVGLAALYFATRFSGSEVVVVEPSIDNIGALTMNVAAHPNVFVERAAAAAADGFSLFLDPGLGQWGYRTTAIQGHVRTSPQGYHTKTTPSLSVESLLHKYHWDGVDYMKIDIEGGELALCRQIKRGAWWPTVVRCMSFEFHDRFGGKFANSSTYCKTALSAAGFEHKGTYKELEVFCQH